MSGLTADARTLIDHARVEAQNYTFTYNEPIAIESITQSVCDIALRFGEDREGREDVMSRPYGVALLIGGVDERGPALFHTDPSGTFLQFYAKAIGSGYEGAQTQLEQSYHKSMTLKEAMVLGLTVLRQVMEEKLTPSNVEIGIIPSDTKKFRLLNGAEIEVRLSARAALLVGFWLISSFLLL
jgi:20S proteasome subunit alpha 5